MQMQQLKTVNGIHCDWQFASLNVIYVPVSIVDGYMSNNPAAELVTRQEMLNSQKMTRTSSDSQIAKDDVISNSGNVKDYFSKYDSSLAEIKGSMDRLTQSIKYVYQLFIVAGIVDFIKAIGFHRNMI